jgi:hypothetical protein
MEFERMTRAESVLRIRLWTLCAYVANAAMAPNAETVNIFLKGILVWDQLGWGW